MTIEAAKILKGLFVRDGATATQKQIDIKSSSSMTAGLRSTAGGNEVTAISSSIDSSGNNRLCVEGINLTGLFTAKSQTTLTSTTARTDNYTVPAGKKWLVHFAGFDRPNAAGCRYNLTLNSVYFNFDTSASGTTGKSTFQFTLNAGDSVQVDALTGSSGNILTYIIYDEFAV